MIICPPMMMVPTAQGGAPPSTPITLVQSVIATVSTSGVLGVNWPSPTTNGNLLVACAGYRTSTTNGGIPALISSGGWTKAVGQADATVAMGRWWGVGIFYIQNAASQSGTVTWTTDAAAALAGMDVTMSEYSGISSAGSLDQSSSASGLGVTASTPSVTISQAKELAVSVFGGSATGVSWNPVGSNFTLRLSSSAVQPSMSYWDQIQSDIHVLASTAVSNVTAISACLATWKGN